MKTPFPAHPAGLHLPRPLAAQAAEPLPAADAACITLSADQQIVRAGADRDILLRNADQHYLVHFKDSCTSAARTSDCALPPPARRTAVRWRRKQPAHQIAEVRGQ